jgi:hypothetical protein
MYGQVKPYFVLKIGVGNHVNVQHHPGRPCMHVALQRQVSPALSHLNRTLSNMLVDLMPLCYLMSLCYRRPPCEVRRLCTTLSPMCDVPWKA